MISHDIFSMKYFLNFLNFIFLESYDGPTIQSITYISFDQSFHKWPEVYLSEYNRYLKLSLKIDISFVNKIKSIDEQMWMKLECGKVEQAKLCEWTNLMIAETSSEAQVEIIERKVQPLRTWKCKKWILDKIYPT